jgi:hypothetical protein
MPFQALRAEDFIHLQHFTEITNIKGPTLVDAAYAEKLHKIELIANHRDGKVWIENLDCLSLWFLKESLFDELTGNHSATPQFRDCLL